MESQIERESALHLLCWYRFQLWRENTSSYLSVYLSAFESEIRLQLLLQLLLQLQLQFHYQFQMPSVLL